MLRKISNPVILIHGFGDVPGLTGSWAPVEEVLREEAGVPRRDILMVQIPALGSIKERSCSAISHISAKFSSRDVHLMGHSMGGLNARDIAARSGTGELDFTVLTVTTFVYTTLTLLTKGTPHYGSKALESNVAARVYAQLLQAFVDMKPSTMAQFNARMRVNPDVKYFTWAGECTIPTVLFSGIWVFTIPFGATDGVVNVDSAEWDPRHCTQLGVMRGADHATILRKNTMRYTIPHLKAAENGGRAPVVEIKNDLVSAVGNRIEGDIQTLLAPVRAFTNGFFGLFS